MDDPAQDYPAWVRAFARLTDADRAAIATQIAAMGDAPRFLLVPLHQAGDTAAMWQPSLDAARSQLYPHWRIALPAEWQGLVDFDDRATWRATPSGDLLAAARAGVGERVDFVVPLVRNVALDERALYEFAVASLASPRAAVLFGDEDHIDAGGTPSRPRFKTGFDPDLMLGRDALGLPVAYRRPLLTELGGLRPGLGPVEVALHDLALRASELVLPDRFRHVPVVLAHRRDAQAWDAAAFAAVVRGHLHSHDEPLAAVAPAPLAPIWLRVTRPLPTPHPLVSVIVPTRDGTELLARCLEGLLYRTAYDALEVLIVDNGSTSPETLALFDHLTTDKRVRVLPCPGPFNYSALNNTAARAATGEVLLLLNNDTDVLEPDWLAELVAHAMRPGVGAVGAKLLYGDRRVQHAGVVVGRGQFIAHQLRLSAADDPGLAGELALARGVRAVTGACLAIRRAVYREVGGLDETVLPVALNDIDLCLRLADHGYRTVFTPFAELLHLESASRGDDMVDTASQARFMRELAAFSGRWAGDLWEDPFHNPIWNSGGTAPSWRRRPAAGPPGLPERPSCANLRHTRQTAGIWRTLTLDELESAAMKPAGEDRAAEQHLDRRLYLLETMRLQAGQRADAARAEATAATARAAAAMARAEAEGRARQAADAAVIAMRSAATQAREDAAKTLREVHNQAAAQLQQAQAHAATMAAEAAHAHQAVAQIQASTAWRITGPGRRLAGRLPPGVRRALRGTAKMLWWTVTFRLPQRLRQRRLILDEVARHAAIAAAAPAPAPPIVVPVIDPGVRAEAVDIVICVHNALSDVQTCIASVIRCTLPPYRLIVVDDGSGAETARYLDAQAAEQGFLLLRRAVAGGYTRAANVGLRAVTAPWVVLLNSDTIVTMNWVERLWAHGARDRTLGVIGPLSNTASWQSVPRIFEPSEDGCEDGREAWAENPLPPGIGIDDMGEMAASLGSRIAPLPFLNGFCYMIRSELLQSVGLFDEETFGAGYGEENDYSIRVRRAGFSLGVATDVYVYHAQSKSYSQERRLTLARRADELLIEKFDAPTEIWPQAGFCRDNAVLASVRAHIAALWRRYDLVREGRARFEGKRVAFILPITELGGGGNVVIQESLALQRMGVDVTLLNLDHNQRSLGSLPDAASPLMRAFPSTEAMTAYLIANEARYDAVVATLYRSVFWLPARTTCRLGYYVQDFEPNFFADNELEQKSALLSYSLDESICLLTKTRWNQAEVARHIGREPALVGPSVDVMAFAPAVAPRPAGVPAGVIAITAMVRPSTPRRAPERTLDVLARIVATFGDRVAVEIFGADDAQLEAAGLGRPWAVNAGRLNQAELATVLARADIFLDCSHYQAMGLTALEAMASGCAVVAPLRGGAEDFIEAGHNGFLVDTTDETACADAVAALVNDAALLAAVQRRAIEDAHRYLPEVAALNLMTELFR